MKGNTDTLPLLEAMQFAAVKHRLQQRNDAFDSPLINHPIEVAYLLAGVGAVRSSILLQAALLHDVVEATPTTFDEIEDRFGADVANIVRECTDDPSLDHHEQKEKQLQRAPMLSLEAKQIRVADKISNLRTQLEKVKLAEGAVSAADLEQARRYRDWSRKIVDAIRGCNPELERQYDALYQESASILENTD